MVDPDVSLRKIPSGRRANRRDKLPLRIDNGRSRKSSPPIASTSKAQSCISPLCLPECNALKIGHHFNTRDHSFAIDDELLLPVLQRSFDNPAKADRFRRMPIKVGRSTRVSALGRRWKRRRL
jgi:hypothetical protein